MNRKSFRTFATSIAFGLAIIGGAAVWQWDVRARRAAATIQRLSQCLGTTFEMRRIYPKWVDRHVPDWIEIHFPHHLKTPTSVQFFPQSFSPKPDLAALIALPDIEELDIVDARVGLQDLSPLRSLRCLKRLSLRGTRVSSAEVEVVIRDLPGVIVEHQDMLIGIWHQEE